MYVQVWVSLLIWLLGRSQGMYRKGSVCKQWEAVWVIENKEFRYDCWAVWEYELLSVRAMIPLWHQVQQACRGLDPINIDPRTTHGTSTGTTQGSFTGTTQGTSTGTTQGSSNVQGPPLEHLQGPPWDVQGPAREPTRTTQGSSNVQGPPTEHLQGPPRDHLMYRDHPRNIYRDHPGTI